MISLKREVVFENNRGHFKNILVGCMIILMFQLWVKSPQFIAATLVSIKALTLRYGRNAKEFSYCKLAKCSHSMGDQVSLSCVKRGRSETMSRFACSDL